MTFIERILCFLLPYFDIVKTVEGEEVVYLRRFFLFRTRWGNLYLHHIMRSDDDPDPHDHPWNFTSLILSGGYMDEAYHWLKDYHRPGAPEARFGPVMQEVRPWTLQRRAATHIHRVVLHTETDVSSFQLEHHPVTAWTLVLTGPYRRSWNFVKPHAFVPWREYLGIPEDEQYGGN